MAKRIKRYLAYIDGLLIVLVLFAILTVVTCIAFVVTSNISLLILALAFMVLLVPYIMHYHLLENSVQYMYDQYDRMMEKSGIKVFRDR